MYSYSPVHVYVRKEETIICESNSKVGSILESIWDSWVYEVNSGYLADDRGRLSNDAEIGSSVGRVHYVELDNFRHGEIAQVYPRWN